MNLVMTRKIRNQINGVLLLDKPLGVSSNQAINRVKYILNASKVGHTGTLDPMATGLLPVCLGEATKFASYLLDGDKEYIATMQLGIVTDSGDAEGNVIATNSVNASLDMIQHAITKFKGQITQVPPMYSALKHNGKPLYEYARAGIEIERKSRQIVVYELELLNYDSALEQVTFRALVSKGTYIRTLAEDLGNYLNCGASLISLRRTKTNNFNLNAAVTIEDVAAEPSLIKILDIEVLLEDMPVLNISSKYTDLIRNGNVCKLDLAPVTGEGEHKLYYYGKFIGVGLIVKEGNDKVFLRPKRMLNNLNQILISDDKKNA